MELIAVNNNIENQIISEQEIIKKSGWFQNNKCYLKFIIFTFITMHLFTNFLQIKHINNIYLSVIPPMYKIIFVTTNICMTTKIISLNVHCLIISQVIADITYSTTINSYIK